MIKHRIFDIITFVTNTVAFSVNFLFFLPMMIEQIGTGWGYPTDYEILTVFFWMVQALTVPLVIYGVVYGVLALLRSRKSAFVYINCTFTVTTILLLVFSVVFAFH